MGITIFTIMVLYFTIYVFLKKFPVNIAETIYSGTPLRPKVAKVEPHTHTKRYAGNFLWSWQAEWLAGACAVHTYIAFHDILT